jgi:putative ATPase
MTDDLFSQSEPIQSPLAHRLRPKILEEYFGQEALLGPGKPLRKWIDADRIPSLLLWGPPGCGKTTLAKLISEKTQSHFQTLSAVTSGVKDLREKLDQAREVGRLYRRKTILFLDEIHRYSQSQQDALLPVVEDGTITLIGATTENPSYSVNSALLSRMRVFKLAALDESAISKLLLRAEKETGVALDEKSRYWLQDVSAGDGRKALLLFEQLIPESVSGRVNWESIENKTSEILGDRTLNYDKKGDQHYGVISALIKSLRGSDPHAGLYYLARLLESGEDPLFILRRLVILASEDIGNADPRALQLAVATKDAFEFLGMPEGRIPLGQLVTYLALAPKSNASYVGIDAALEEVRTSGALPIPLHLQPASNATSKALGAGKDYIYAHESQTGLVKQTHLPSELVGRRFYEPKEVGLERQLKERLDQLNPLFEK